MPRSPKSSTAASPAAAPHRSKVPAAKRTRTTTAAKSAKDAKSGFLATQKEALLDERRHYLAQAEELKAQADALALEHEPGDVQFDEEGGEGGTSNVDRELDLALSNQARVAIEEIDRALAKIDAGTYGACERCGQPIPEARLEALPHAALCVSCKSGGLSSRR
jgi:DnaK suppressor protein